MPIIDVTLAGGCTMQQLDLLPGAAGLTCCRIFNSLLASAPPTPQELSPWHTIANSLMILEVQTPASL